jgi:hypothetical protein
MIAVFGPRFGQIHRQGNNGGQSPGEQNSFQTQNTSSSSTNTSAPSPAIQDPLMKQVNALQGYYDTNPTAPSFFPQETVAAPSQATKSYWQQLADYSANGMGYGIDNLNKKLISDTLAGNYLDPSKNPWLQADLQAGYNTQDRQFNNVQTPAMRSQFEGSGRNLGGADMGTYQEALNNLNQGQSNATAHAMESAYDSERGRQMQTQSMLPSFQGMDLQRINAMGQAGQGIDDYTQALIKDAMTRYNYNATAQPNYFSDAASRYLAAYPGGTTTGNGSGTSTGSGYTRFMAPSNPTASGIGAGLAGAGTIAQFLPFLSGGGGGGMFSDERLKEEIRPVGKLRDGQNVYSYRYKGDPRTQIGLLAQEVERVHPDAVTTHPSGYKMVDYGRATAPAGGLM